MYTKTLFGWETGPKSHPSLLLSSYFMVYFLLVTTLVQTWGTYFSRDFISSMRAVWNIRLIFSILTHIQSIFTKHKNDILSTRGHSYCSKSRAKDYGTLRGEPRVGMRDIPGLLKSSMNARQNIKNKFSLLHFKSSLSIPSHPPLHQTYEKKISSILMNSM